MRLTVLCVSCAVGLPLTAAASPQDFDLEAIRASKRVTAVRASERIVVDGTLDEAAGALAEPAVDFYQQFPDEFGPPPSAATCASCTTTPCCTSAR